jgi:hypothetical protein
MSRHNMLEQYDRVTKSYAMQQRLRRKADTSDDDDIDDDHLDGGNGNDRHLVDVVADLLVEAGSSDGPVDRQTALRWLLHSKEGQSLIVRLAPYRKQIERATSTGKGFTMPTRQEVLKGYVRSAGGVMPLCKRIVAKGTTDITEHELVSLLVTELKRAEPDLSDAQAFTKAFTGPSGAMLQQAVQVAKVAQVIGNDDDDDDDAAAALEELQRLADAHQRKHPELTGQQAFARVFSDPRHAALAHGAHKRPTANEKNAFPFPR